MLTIKLKDTSFVDLVKLTFDDYGGLAECLKASIAGGTPNIEIEPKDRGVVIRIIGEEPDPEDTRPRYDVEFSAKIKKMNVECVDSSHHNDEVDEDDETEFYSGEKEIDVDEEEAVFDDTDDE